jgi:putative ABC transport system permease protein
MRTVFRASLRTHFRRYVAAAIAVIVSVATVVVTGLLISGARAGLMNGDGAPYRNSDHVVDADPAAAFDPARRPYADVLNTAEAIALVDRLGERASGFGRVRLPAHADGGVRPGAGGGGPGNPTTVGPIAAGAALRWQKLVSGRYPARPGEAVLHMWDARAWGMTVGDRIRIGVGATATDLQVVGLVDSRSTWTQASVYVTWPQYVRWRDNPTFHVGAVAVRGEVGPVPDGAVVWSTQDYVAEGFTGLSNGVDFLSVMLLLFAGVALFVAVLVMANTFSIVLAHRLRDLALLRCVGATRRQVLGSVRAEAAAVGVLASLTGTLAGVGLGHGLIAVINVLADPAPLGAPGLPALWLLGGFTAGLVTTVVASWLPTRRVVRVTPLAALRPDTAVDMHTATGRARLRLAAFVLLAGLALLEAAMVRHSTAIMVAGGAMVFTGVLLIGPVLVPRLVRTAGALLGPGGRLATENAVRNPRRTAATTAALLVGVTLATAVLTGMATWRVALTEQRDRHHAIDAALSSPDAPTVVGLLDRVRRTPGVERAVAVDGSVARISGFDGPIPIVAAPDVARVARDRGDFAQVRPGAINLDLGAFDNRRMQPGDVVTVRVGEREIRLRVLSLSGWGQAGVVSPATLAQLTDTPAPHVIWVRATPDADRLRLVGALHELARPVGARIDDQLQARAVEDRELDVLTWSVLGLLAVSVAIALVGIANTLGLSVLERAREHALLRALGLTRRQLRWMVAAEAVLLSVVAGALGTVIGVGFAGVGYEAVVKRALTHATMLIPWPQLAGVVLVAGLAGLLASVLPARRAARVTPTAGLSLD